MEVAIFKRELKVSWVSFIADFLLAGMVVGPLAAPFLANSLLPLLPGIAGIIYFMGEHVCPQPDMGLMLASPHIMAVCMRCYGTVTGLLITRLLFAKTGGKGFYWLTQYGWWGAALSSVLMMAYPLELAAEVAGWWGFNNYVVTAFGLITGLGWGLFTMPILHGWRRVTPRTSLLQRQRAEQAERKAAQLAARLRTMGIDSDAVE